jgi:hypothetical protein
LIFGERDCLAFSSQQVGLSNDGPVSTMYEFVRVGVFPYFLSYHAIIKDITEKLCYLSGQRILIQISEVRMPGWVQVAALYPVQAAIITELLVHHLC